MGYRDDLIERLKQEGIWDQLTSHHQERFQGLSDDQARQMMVTNDQWDMGDMQAVELFGVISLVNVIQSFNGALVERQGARIGKLSRAGRKLAEFCLELQEAGMSPDDVDAGLRGLGPLVIAALTTVYKRSGETE